MPLPQFVTKNGKETRNFLLMTIQMIGANCQQKLVIHVILLAITNFLEVFCNGSSFLLDRIEVLCQGGRLENLSYWLIVSNLPVRWSFFPDDSPVSNNVCV